MVTCTDQPDPVFSNSNTRGRIARRAILLAALCGFIYLLIVGSFCFDFKQTDYAHHILMADAFLHGQFHIRPEVLRDKTQRIVERLAADVEEAARITGHTLTPALRRQLIEEPAAGCASSDWAVLDGKVYGYWAPLTPVLMMPFVAVFGTTVSDEVLNVLFGALNVGLFYWLLWRITQAGLLRIEESGRVALCFLLAFGTSHFWLTCTAQVWFAVHVVTFTTLLAATLAICAARLGIWHCLLAGLFFGAALLGRNIVVVMGLFFIVVIWQRAAGRFRTFFIQTLVFCLPVALAVVLQGAYNHARFGSVLNSGLEIQVSTGGLQRFHDVYQQYGLFSLHHVPNNFLYYFLNFELPTEPDGRIWFDREGNSLFLVTPPMIYIFWAWRRRTPFTRALFAGVLPLVVVLMLYFATGFVQFGPRYLLDGMALLLLLVATGMQGRLTPVSYILIVLAVAANLFGTYRLCEEEFVLITPWMRNWTLPALVFAALLTYALLMHRHQTR
ncbi:MAG: hypothetical protein ABIG44_16500 [Planctomycetota bacterium]